MKKIIDRIANWYRALPEKKKYIEFVTAVLSVPVMLTVIILNLNNLKQQKPTAPANEKVTPIQIVITGEGRGPTSALSNLTGTPIPTPSACVKEVGAVSILSPRENEVVSKNPVCISIATLSNYCPTVWSYRVDNGDWSDFTDADVCLRNLSNGNKTLQVRIRSTASNDEVTLQRTFIYQGSAEPTALPPSSSSSAALQ